MGKSSVTAWESHVLELGEKEIGKRKHVPYCDAWNISAPCAKTANVCQSKTHKDNMKIFVQVNKSQPRSKFKLTTEADEIANMEIKLQLYC